MTTDPTAPEPFWWLCPNGTCPHGAIFHDVEDREDDTPTCAIEGCQCGKGASRDD